MLIDLWHEWNQMRSIPAWEQPDTAVVHCHSLWWANGEGVYTWEMAGKTFACVSKPQKCWRPHIVPQPFAKHHHSNHTLPVLTQPCKSSPPFPWGRKAGSRVLNSVRGLRELLRFGPHSWRPCEPEPELGWGTDRGQSWRGHSGLWDSEGRDRSAEGRAWVPSRVQKPPQDATSQHWV